jgi:glycosyltransferase involved in cell wall biosynthesis
LDLLPVYWAAHGRASETFYPGWLRDWSSRRVKRIAPDVVHLHWITGGFINVNSLSAYGVPLVWTLHDMWPFTGGCHYDGGCGRYNAGCGQCPILASNRERDLSAWVWRRKNRAYQKIRLNIVTPSRWLGELAGRSRLLGNFPIHVIPNAIDIEVYRPIDKSLARDSLNLPVNGKVILFSALRATSERRKGFHLLQSALKALSLTERGRNTIAVVVGAKQPVDAPDFGMKTIFLGTMNEDDKLAMAYSAADVFVAPSTEENLSNAVMESIACGTPAVAFNIGGMPDMIDHHQNGYLAKPFETMDLANGLHWVLEDDQRRGALSENARKKAVRAFESATVAERHRSLYESLL